MSHVRLVPAGTILPFGGASAPGGYLLCDGTSYLRADYAELFAAIGTIWGTADGTHFNVPDLQGRFLRGHDNGQGVDPDAGSRTACNAGGETGDKVGTIQANATKLPNTAFTTDNPGNHKHGTKYANTGAAGTGRLVVDGSAGLNETYEGSDGSHTHSITGGGDNESRPVNAAVNFIIKT